MAGEAARILAGARIRARRLDAGLAQGELARRVGISASYLNLIEHERRRIGGRLLNAIARALDADPGQLAQGADAALMERLGAAMATRGAAQAADAEALAARFPDWAGLVATQAARIEALEAQVGALGDRLAHDPELSASLHQVITAATAIRSTASILAGSEDLDRDWQARFHRNIHAESLRLAESSRKLAGYLDTPETGAMGALSPLDAVERFLEAHDHHIAALEGTGAVPRPADLAQEAPGLDAAARVLLSGWLDTYRADAVALPLDRVAQGWRETPEPLALAARLGCDLPRLLRRLATLPPDAGPPRAGGVSCDASGALGPRRALDGVTLPRGGAACPLWPLFEAMSQPGRPLRLRAVLPGGAEVLCYAVAGVETGPDWDAPSRLGAVMLMLPGETAPEGLARREVGPGCRLCPRAGCPARREPSLLPPASVL